MTRLTISLPDELHRALKVAAARRNRRMGDLIAESLDFYGIKTTESAVDLVARARRQSDLDGDVALELAVEEARSSHRE